jgi:tetratricopeptide (TPR) repeat protein
MKTYKLKIILLAFGSVFLTSCNKLLYTSLDVLRPAKVAFEPEAKRLLIVNNSVTQPSDYGHKTLLTNEKPKNIDVITDSLSIFCLGALTEDMDEKNFFSSVLLLPNSINTSKNFTSINKLNSEDVKKLCSSNHADAILSLDKIKVNDEISEYYLNDAGSYLSTFEVKYETSWSIHYPNKSNATTIQFNDTVFWEAESYFRKKGLNELPNRKDGLIDGALNVGQKSVNRFVPYWEKVDRYFFDSKNKLMKQGMDSVYVKNWTAAIDCWKKALDKTKNIATKGYATNNIAIAYEITGDLDKAIDYATQSYNFMCESPFAEFKNYMRIMEYINELGQRKKDNVIIKKQLGE